MLVKSVCFSREGNIKERQELFMATEFKQSETMKNLMRAFAGESQARNRYTFAASQAHQQGLYVIEKVFQFTSEQEKEHAEVFYNQLKELAGETIEIDKVGISWNELEFKDNGNSQEAIWVTLPKTAILDKACVCYDGDCQK